MSNQNLFIAALFILMAGGAYAGLQAYTMLRADMVEIGWRVNAIEETLAGLEPEAMTEASDALAETARELRDSVDAIAATANIAAERASETGALYASTAGRLDALEGQIAEIQAGIASVTEDLALLDDTVSSRTVEVVTAPVAPTAPAQPDTDAAVAAALAGEAADVVVEVATPEAAGETVAEAPAAAAPSVPTDASAAAAEAAALLAAAAAAVGEPIGLSTTVTPAAPAAAAEVPTSSDIAFVASDTTWIRVVGENGGSIFEGLLDPNETITVPADRQPVVARLGNGGQVFVSLNGELRGPFGSAGTVLELSSVDAAFVAETLPVADALPQPATPVEVSSDTTADDDPIFRPRPRPTN